MARSNNSGVEVHISSYTRGGTFETGTFHKLGDLLAAYDVNSGEAVVEVTDEEGEERKVTAAGVLKEGDTVIIMKAKNKSGI